MPVSVAGIADFFMNSFLLQSIGKKKLWLSYRKRLLTNKLHLLTVR